MQKIIDHKQEEQKQEVGKSAKHKPVASKQTKKNQIRLIQKDPQHNLLQYKKQIKELPKISKKAVSDNLNSKEQTKKLNISIAKTNFSNTKGNYKLFQEDPISSYIPQNITPCMRLKISNHDYNKIRQLDCFVQPNSFQIFYLKQLGKGGFGRVYLGKWRGLDVAIKAITLVNQKDLQNAIEQLKKIIKLRHQRIIIMYKFSFEETISSIQFYLIMQKLEGDLTQYKYKDFKDRIRIIKQISQGILNLHEQQIVHRDIKPQNILYDLKGDIRICDLGISKILQNKDDTVSKTLAYTLKYSPREVVFYNITSFKNDIWSFGLVIYQIITGMPVWQNMNGGAINMALVKGEFPLKGNWKQNVLKSCGTYSKHAQQLIDILCKCLDYESSGRPTIKQIFERLEKLMNTL